MPIALGDAKSGDALGKKAANLDVLVRAGFRVPPGFVLVDGEHASEAELAKAIDAIGGFPVAVRSSGILEDLAGASFAGQYETFLHVADVATLVKRVADCRASAKSERVLAYLADHGLPADKARLAVLVQKMVDPRIAGVAFSVHPVTGREEDALVEAVGEVGEALVSGTANPSSFTVRLRDGEVTERRLDDARADLAPSEAKEMARVLTKIQAHFGRPQDIEWAIDKAGDLFLLQARPITSVTWRTDLGELSTSNMREGGIAARVCYPFVQDLIGGVMGRSLQAYLENVRLMDGDEEVQWMRLVYGRPYWNVGALKEAMRGVPGFDEASFDAGLGIVRDYGAAGPRRTGWGPAVVLRAVPTAVQVYRWYGKTLRMLEGHEEAFAEKEKALLAPLPADADDAAIAERLKDALAFFEWNETVYLTVGYTNNSAHRELLDTVASIDALTKGTTDSNALIGGLAGVSHVRTQSALEALADVARGGGIASAAYLAARAKFLDEHGFHSDVELDASEPRWEEVPERIDTRVRGILATETRSASSDSGAARFEKEHASVVERLRAAGLRGRYRRGRFERRLERARTLLRHKESMRELSTKSYRVVRRAVLAAADRLLAREELRERDDVFLLRPAELVARFAEGRALAAEEIAFRRARHDGFRDFDPPGELGGVVVEEAAEVSGNALRGVACSPGRVEGSARVVKTLDELGTVVDGEILVTRFTDPNWTPALTRVRGIVTEVGGVLSHAAVIGREYGIPAVLNVTGATTAIRTGQRVRVDGNAGTVELLDG
ncbi:MAG: PEP/pyruvate-binding domain-containing protein [Polyangiaceae bacterium]